MEITNILGRENCVILLHPNDDVAIARAPLAQGQRVDVAGRQLVLRDPIPAGHKLALRAIEAGEVVKRYGEAIGRASRPIQPGEHIHSHNLRFEEPALEYQFPAAELPALSAPASGPMFLGYRRANGSVGTRNYIAIVAASNCAAHTVELAARSFEGRQLPPNVDGVVAFPHGHGCGGMVGRDGELLHRTIAGVMDHPNVFAALIVGLGCELNQIDDYLGGEEASRGRLTGLTMQSSGGTSATVEAAGRQVTRVIEQAAAEQRVQAPASKIVLGLNCGGSDSFSGITANPALGVCTDLLAAAGGTAVLAETPEIFGAEHLLVKRAASREVAERLLGFIDGYKKYVSFFGGTLDDNPAHGNKEGGLTNIVEKSLGAVAKGGASPLRDAVDYAERVRSSGLVFMNTPGYDPVSLTGLAAGGVNLIAFTTGRGSAIGFPTIPVVKIASNTAIFQRMRENMDINAGVVADGRRSIDEVGREIFDTVMRVASGERTASERLGHKEFVPWRVGPVL
jgi:altronate hydrolase